jgi:hypothetical protein
MKKDSNSGIFCHNWVWVCPDKIWYKVGRKVSKEINTEYADAKTSPLMSDDLAAFNTLDFTR